MYPTIPPCPSFAATGRAGYLGGERARVDAAVEKAYGGKRKIEWLEGLPARLRFKKFNNWLPDDTVTAFRDYLVGIKGR